MDELAAAAGHDPLDFRLAHLQDRASAPHCKLAADKFDWKNRRANPRDKNTGIGLACAAEKGSFVAACAQVLIDPDKHTFRVTHVTQAFDAGAIVNPANLQSQVTGGIIMGIGALLREAMQFENGRITNASFWDSRSPACATSPPSTSISSTARKSPPPAPAKPRSSPSPRPSEMPSMMLPKPGCAICP